MRRPKTSDDRWNFAVDWLLNSPYTADPDIQEPFWAYVDGYLTRKELDQATWTSAQRAMKRRNPRVDR